MSKTNKVPQKTSKATKTPKTPKTRKKQPKASKSNVAEHADLTNALLEKQVGDFSSELKKPVVASFQKHKKARQKVFESIVKSTIEDPHHPYFSLLPDK